jgi:hypothetical protein
MTRFISDEISPSDLDLKCAHTHLSSDLGILASAPGALKSRSVAVSSNWSIGKNLSYAIV